MKTTKSNDNARPSNSSSQSSVQHGRDRDSSQAPELNAGPATFFPARSTITPAIQPKASEDKGETHEEQAEQGGADLGLAQRKPAFDSGDDGDAQGLLQRRADTGHDGSTFFRAQTKLTVGSPNDPLEREADEVADRVVRRVQQSDTAEKRPLSGRIMARSQSESSPPPVPDRSVEQQLDNARGSGKQIDEPEKSQMESSFGADFGDVGIHTGSEAADLSRSLNAHAFTHGNDIYFNEGQYRPDTSEGKHLLAHELTHTIQQGAVRRSVIRRVDSSDSGSDPVADAKQLPKSRGQLSANESDIVFDSIGIPGFKLKDHRGALYNGHRPLKRMKGYNESLRPPFNSYTNEWFTKIDSAKIRSTLKEKLGREYEGDNKTYVFRVDIGGRSRGGRGPTKPYFIGTLDEVAHELKVPTWVGTGSRPAYARLQKDHIVELQVANWDADKSWANTIDNLELLDEGMNRASGNAIKANINSKIDTFNRATKNHFAGNASSVSKRQAAIKNKYTLVFENVANSRRGPRSISSRKFWTSDQIANADHLGAVAPASLAELEQQGKVRVFSKNAGGVAKTFSWDPSDPAKGLSAEKAWFKDPFVITRKEFDTTSDAASLGHLHVNLKQNAADKYRIQKPGQDMVLPVHRYPGAPSVGYIDKTQARGAIRNFFGVTRIRGLSPIRFDEFDLAPDGGLMIVGKIITDLPILNRAEIDFRIANGEVEIFKEFNTGDFAVPSPFIVHDTSLRVFASTRRGLGAEGRIDFGIQGVAEGRVEASLATQSGFELSGSLDFDTKLFDPAQVSVEYKNEVLSVTGALGISAGKVRGVKQASITVSYSENVFSAAGQAQLDVPGVQEGTLNANYNSQTGAFAIGGTFQLKNDIPGIRGGSVEAQVSRDPAQEGYEVSISGEAQPDIPGFDAKLSIEYENGALTIAGRAAYSRGMLSGEVNVGATNRAIGTDGQPSGDPTDNFTVYGGGELSLALTPWLKATAGVQFLPNGEIQVKGEIGLPNEIDVFDRIGIPESELFSLGFDIPIFAIPVGPKSIGLKATIRGGMKAHAGIGPGKLTDTRLGIEYNPAHEDQTHLYGSAKFVVPADAGLKFFVRATVGLNAVIGGVEGGLEVSAGVGLDAEASAAVNLDWTPASGLELRATLAAHIQPKFSFDIDGVIEAWFAWYDKEWRWSLASYEYGPDMRFGIKLPIVYKEGEPFDISFDDIEFEKPNIDMNFLKGLIRDIRNSRD